MAALCWHIGLRDNFNVMSEIYVSTDVEVDGPIPGPHSMLCFGSAAYLPDKTIVSIVVNGEFELLEPWAPLLRSPGYHGVVGAA